MILLSSLLNTGALNYPKKDKKAHNVQVFQLQVAFISYTKTFIIQRKPKYKHTLLEKNLGGYLQNF